MGDESRQLIWVPVDNADERPCSALELGGGGAEDGGAYEGGRELEDQVRGRGEVVLLQDGPADESACLFWSEWARDATEAVPASSRASIFAIGRLWFRRRCRVGRARLRR